MKRYTFVLLSVFVCFTTIYAQSKSAIEFYDTTGSEPASRIGWTGDKDNGHFFIATPGEEGEIKVQNGNLEVNGTVKAEKFEGDGSGLTNLPCSSNGVSEINITNADVNEDGELIFELSDGETIEAGVVRGADGAVGINWRGTWDSEKTYKERDAVSYKGSSYLAIDDPTDEPGVDDTWNLIAKKGDKGETGSGGTGSGISIENASVNDSGKLVLELSDGSKITAGVVKGTDGANGKDGADGKDGISIENASVDDSGKLVLELSDGNKITAGVVKGTDGADGKDGSDGEDGISISNASVNGSGELVLELSDGNEITTGVVKGADGADGKDGSDGKDGISISNASINTKGELVIKLDDGGSINAGVVRDSILTDTSLAFINDNAVISVASTSPTGASTIIEPGKASVSAMGNGVYLSTSDIKITSPFGDVNISTGGISVIARSSGNTTTISGNSIKTDTIKASEIIVDGAPLGVPDYVFENNYRLKSLNEVESFIKKHKHLPEVQSAKEIEKNGMDVVKMNLDLLKKVEELTLYVLEQEKKMSKQEKKMSKMEQEIKSLKNQK